MKFIKTKFENLKIIQIKKKKDLRGNFLKIFNKKYLKDYHLEEAYISVSKKGSVRGLHGQKGKFSQRKIVFCLNGKFLDVCIDLRKNSKTYGKIFKKIISSKSSEGLLIPKGFAHGVLALEDNSILINFCDAQYQSKSEFGINFKSLKINFPKLKTLYSKKDKNLPYKREMTKKD